MPKKKLDERKKLTNKECTQDFVWKFGGEEKEGLWGVENI